MDDRSIEALEDVAEAQPRLEALVRRILEEAAANGASGAEVGVNRDTGLSVTVRRGEIETVEFNRDQGFGITVYFGQRKGSASTSDSSEKAIGETVRAACNIARYTEEDPFNGLADASLMPDPEAAPDLDLYHPWEIGPEEAETLALDCEARALGFDPRIGNSEGASVTTGQGCHVYGNSHGFVGGYSSTRHSLSCAVIASEGEDMQRDYWYTMARVADELESPTAVGEMAGQRTVARLGARAIDTRQVPVVYAAEIAGGVIGHFVAAISGGALYRNASFLLDSLGEQIFPDHVTIDERPLLPGGIASAWFDGDGVATRAKAFVRGGVLESYCLGTYAARKLGMTSTGNAGGVHNLFITTGDKSRAELLRARDRGFLVTELMGFGVNMVTGDYSRG
ncbi:MAG: metalloprotease PmbA, partial [Gammaproteobacteria bacterium]